MRRSCMVAALGFLVGAAALAGGEEDDVLNEKLRRLEETIQRLRAQRAAPENVPVAAGPAVELGLMPVYDLSMGLRSHRAPVHGKWERGSELPLFGGSTEESFRSVGTVEELVEYIRSSVWPGSYEEGATIGISGQTMLVLNSRAALTDTRKELETLRDRVHRCVVTEFDVVDMPHALFRELQGGGAALSKEQQAALRTALTGEAAHRVFHSRVIGYAGQQVYAWHGKQVALAADARIEVAKGVAISDPKIDVLNTGGYISVRPSLGDDPAHIALDIDARFDEIGPIKTRDTGRAGSLDFVSVRDAGVRTTTTVPQRTWTLVGGGARGGASVRALLVRATVTTRKDGVR